MGIDTEVKVTCDGCGEQDPQWDSKFDDWDTLRAKTDECIWDRAREIDCVFVGGCFFCNDCMNMAALLCHVSKWDYSFTEAGEISPENFKEAVDTP